MELTVEWEAVYAGLGYADDFTIMVLYHKRLQSVIHICVDYTNDYDV